MVSERKRNAAITKSRQRFALLGKRMLLGIIAVAAVSVFSGGGKCWKRSRWSTCAFNHVCCAHKTARWRDQRKALDPVITGVERVVFAKAGLAVVTSDEAS